MPKTDAEQFSTIFFLPLLTPSNALNNRQKIKNKDLPHCTDPRKVNSLKKKKKKVINNTTIYYYEIYKKEEKRKKEEEKNERLFGEGRR